MLVGPVTVSSGVQRWRGRLRAPSWYNHQLGRGRVWRPYDRRFQRYWGIFNHIGDLLEGGFRIALDARTAAVKHGIPVCIHDLDL